MCTLILVMVHCLHAALLSFNLCSFTVEGQQLWLMYQQYIMFIRPAEVLRVFHTPCFELLANLSGQRLV